MAIQAQICLFWRKKTPSRAILISLSMIFLALGGCGGGGDGGSATTVPPATVSLTGTIIAPDGVTIDGDVNDPNEIYVANDTLATAQALANPVSVGGYVNEAATGSSGRSYAIGDRDDYFSIQLNVGDKISLAIGDPDDGDLDLFLYDTGGTLIDSSQGTQRFETIASEAAGTYVVNVHAYAGASNYILTIGVDFGDSTVDTLSMRYDFVPGQAIVRFKDGSGASAERAIAMGMALTAGGAEREMLLTFDETDTQAGVYRSLGVTKRLSSAKTDDATLTGKMNTLDIIKALRKRADVLFADPNYILHHYATEPNDQYYPLQWHYPQINLPLAWDLATGSADVIVAVVDTGVLMNHPDLAGQLTDTGYDFISDAGISNDGDGIDADPDDPGDNATAGASSFHGTHCAGTIAAATNNKVDGGFDGGVAGVSWNARIMPIRVLGEDGDGTVDDLAAGISWAVDQGAWLLNLSLGTYEDSTPVRDAIVYAHTNGVLVVAAMGNDNTGDRFYPAAYEEEVLAVAATGPNDARAPYSNFGDYCDVAAPGGTELAAIYSTMPTYPVWKTKVEGHSTWYDYVYGTSQATAYVTGLAALIWAKDLSLSAAQVQTTIEATAKDLGTPGWDPSYGYGRIDPLAALQAHTAPLAPVLAPISNAAGASAYLIDWSDVPFAATYTLQEADNPLFSAPNRYEDLLSSQLQVTGRVGGTWYYRVRATNSYGASPWSGTQLTTVRPAAPVLSPIPNSGNLDEYQLNWSAVVGATGYRLEESDDGTFADPTTRYQGDALHYDVTGQPGGAWSYRVVAYNGAGDGPPGNVESTLVSPPALLAPDLNPIDNEDGDSEYLVSWSSVGQELTYTLEQGADAYFSTPVVILSGPEQQASIVGQSRGRWYYRVRASDQAGKSPWSQARSAVVPFLVLFPEIARNYAPSGLLNGGFENGSVGWVQSSVKGLPLILNATALAPVAPHSGTWAARLGREHDPVSYIEQRVTVPPDRPFLHYWYWIASVDECGFDVASVRVNDALSRFYYLCKSTSTGQWLEAVINLGSYSGQTVSLRLRVEADLVLESNLYVDDFSFEAAASADAMDEPQEARPWPGW